MVATRDCPQCADGKIEVGHDSSVAECVELSRYLLRKERGPRAADDLAVRFTDEIIMHLPCDRTWSLDACTIRDWVDDIGRVVAFWDREQHTLPPANYQPAPKPRIAYPGGDTPAAPTFLPAGTAAAMDDVLAGITGDDF